MTISTTLVVPVLNEADSIGELLMAIEHQIKKPNQIIFVDGGSSDSTLNIINTWISKNKLPDHLIEVMHNPKGLPGSNRNMGVKNAIHDWIIFLDAGISPRANWISELVSWIQAGNSWYAYGLCEFDGQSDFQKTVCALTYGVGSVHPVIPASIFHKKIFDEIGYFPENLRAGEDLVWMRKLAKSYGGDNICRTALVDYVHFPIDISKTVNKWFSVTKSVVLSGERNAQLMIYLLTFFSLPLIFFVVPFLGALLFLSYLLLRGLYDPIRRSVRKPWWVGSWRCILIAVLVGVVIDFSKLAGAIYGYGSQIRK